MEDRRLMRLKDGHLAIHADLSGVFDSEPNDMVVDRLGRAYVGSIGRVATGDIRPQPSPIVLVTPDGEVRIAARDLEMPNGAAITPDGRRLIVAETVGKRLTSFEVGFDGSLKGKRTFAAIIEGSPDGICLDAAGGAWAGLPNGEQFLRITEGGAITHRIPTPGKMAVACALGGNDRRTLYLLTAERQEPDIKTNRRAWVSSLRVETPGAGWP
jgi:sugar lactone lactonase YvrE